MNIAACRTAPGPAVSPLSDGRIHRNIYKFRPITTLQKSHPEVKTIQFNYGTQSYEQARSPEADRYSYVSRRQYASLAPKQLHSVDGPDTSKRLFFSSVAVPGIDQGPQTVEQILKHGYMDLPAGDSVTAILQDKRHASWLGLDDILGQIPEREQIYRKNMLEIEWGKCYAFNEVARLGWPATPKAWYSYQKRIQELHAEQRDKRVAAWRDISKLRQLLPESIQLHLSALRKSDILDGLDGDAP
jgi:hypothetical protein